jgi:hypothetical protein
MRALRWPWTTLASFICPVSFGAQTQLTSQRRASVAVWSFLLRPVCSFPPISFPTISLNLRSLAVKMSSSSSLMSNYWSANYGRWRLTMPWSHSSSTIFNPRIISCSSWAFRIPARARPLAYATDPWISTLYMSLPIILMVRLKLCILPVSACYQFRV